MDHLHLLFGALCLDEGEVEARSMLAFSLVIGHHFMAADHGARSHADVLKLAANWRSDSQPETRDAHHGSAPQTFRRHLPGDS